MTTSLDALIFRSMTLEDIPDVIAIEEEAFTSPWTGEAFRNELMSNMFAKYMAMELNGEVIGYGGMWIIMDEAHITNIAICDRFRGKGLGHRLMEELQRTALFFGAVKMTLEVRVSNEHAQHLYRKHGFEPAGVRPGYYSDNNEDALIMWAELDQEQLEMGEQ